MKGKRERGAEREGKKINQRSALKMGASLYRTRKK